MSFDFVEILGECYKFLEIPLTMYGFTFRFIDLILWSLFVGLIVWVINEVFY